MGLLGHPLELLRIVLVDRQHLPCQVHLLDHQDRQAEEVCCRLSESKRNKELSKTYLKLSKSYTIEKFVFQTCLRNVFSFGNLVIYYRRTIGSIS